MTEKERLYLAERIGAIMDASDSERGNEQEQDPAIHIHIHSPDNRIAGRDFIEVNIYPAGKSDRKEGEER